MAYLEMTNKPQKLCYRCGGTGKYMGNGMIMTDCKCEDLHHDVITSKHVVNDLGVVDRRSKSYKKAIEDIMALNPNIGRDEAVKMFDDAYVQV